MIGGISGAGQMGQMSVSANNTSKVLSSDKLQLIEETLAEFDAANLTEANAKAIVEVFSEADINPGKELAFAMAESGFSAQEVGKLAGVGPASGAGQVQGVSAAQGGRPPPPPPQKMDGLEISDDDWESLTALLADYNTGELSEEDTDTVLSSIQSILKASAPEGGIMHVVA
jgi:hypothetical protein